MPLRMTRREDAEIKVAAAADSSGATGEGGASDTNREEVAALAIALEEAQKQLRQEQVKNRNLRHVGDLSSQVGTAGASNGKTPIGTEHDWNENEEKGSLSAEQSVRFGGAIPRASGFEVRGGRVFSVEEMMLSTRLEGIVQPVRWVRGEGPP